MRAGDEGLAGRGRCGLDHDIHAGCDAGDIVAPRQIGLVPDELRIVGGLAGAGFGILSAHLAYLTHRNRWGRKGIGRDVGMMPMWSPAGGAGFALSWRPR